MSFIYDRAPGILPVLFFFFYALLFSSDLVTSMFVFARVLLPSEASRTARIREAMEVLAPDLETQIVEVLPPIFRDTGYRGRGGVLNSRPYRL